MGEVAWPGHMDVLPRAQYWSLGQAIQLVDPVEVVIVPLGHTVRLFSPGQK